MRSRLEELRNELRGLEHPERIRARTHAALPSLAARRAYDLATARSEYAALVELSALTIARVELLASYRDDAERPSGERAVLGRVQLLKRPA